MALYLGKDKIAGFSTDSKIGDTLPVGAIIDYDGEEVPANWELVEDNETDNSGAITFTIEDVQYQALRGMSWREWVNSSANTIPLSISGGYIYVEGVADTQRIVLSSEDDYVSFTDDRWVRPIDMIMNNYNYQIFNEK